MTKPARPLRGGLRRPRAIAAIVVAAGLTVGAVGTVHAAGVEAEARESLRHEVDRVVSSIASRIDSGQALVATQLAAAVCVAETSERLTAGAEAGTRFPPELVERVVTLMQHAADAEPVPAYDPLPPDVPAAEAGRDELETALAELTGDDELVAAEVGELASAAQHAGVQCLVARGALADLVNEVRVRTDEVVAANPKAAGDATTALAGARDAVVAGEKDGVARWLAAATSVESTHAAAVLAEEQADAGRQAERNSRAGSDESTSTVPDDLSGLSGRDLWCAMAPDSMRTDPVTGAQTRIC